MKAKHSLCSQEPHYTYAILFLSDKFSIALGAMRTAPTAAMEALLGLRPLHLQVEVEDRVGN
jgi:hypothetical protein